MSRLAIHIMEFDELQQAMKDFQGNTEEAINDVLHNEGGQLIEDAVKRLMPVSGKTWRGKKPAAKSSNSLQIVGENLSVTVKTKKAYQYLYFPDDGTSTRRHVGNKQFFLKGGESQRDEIVNRCVLRLVNEFES